MKLINSVRHILNSFFSPAKADQNKIDKSVELINKENIFIDSTSIVRKGVVIQAANKKISIGKFCQLNPYVIIYGGEVIIGDYVMIAPHVVIAAGEHNYKQIEKPMRFAGGLGVSKIVIEDDVWIGANSTITDGVTIGRGAVIGANSVVTADVAPYDIIAGVPGKKIMNRLDFK